MFIVVLHDFLNTTFQKVLFCQAKCDTELVALNVFCSCQKCIPIDPFTVNMFEHCLNHKPLILCFWMLDIYITHTFFQCDKIMASRQFFFLHRADLFVSSEPVMSQESSTQSPIMSRRIRKSKSGSLGF